MTTVVVAGGIVEEDEDEGRGVIPSITTVVLAVRAGELTGVWLPSMSRKLVFKELGKDTFSMSLGTTGDTLPGTPTPWPCMAKSDCSCALVRENVAPAEVSTTPGAGTGTATGAGCAGGGGGGGGGA